MQVMQKFTDEIYNNIFVTSDTHFNHNKEFIYGNRGYKNIEDMNASMIKTINDTVTPNGILLHLGDFCLNTTKESYNDIVRQLKVKEIWMLWGNHNNPIQKTYGGTREQIAAYNGNTLVKYLDYYFTFRKGKKTFVCFHFPIRVWDGMHNGVMHLCGHNHGNLPITRPEDNTYKVLDCGWDVHGRPISMKEIEDIMRLKGATSI